MVVIEVEISASGRGGRGPDHPRHPDRKSTAANDAVAEIGSPNWRAYDVWWHLVLLCHKFGCLLRAAQHGQRESVVARAATNLRRIVAIEFGTWRSGRNGGSSGRVTFA